MSPAADTLFPPSIDPLLRGQIITQIFIVTDCEFDGPTPGVNSMLAFASVAMTAEGTVLGEFEAVLQPLDGAKRDEGTMAFWRTQPEAWEASTRDPQPPGEVMARFDAWVRAFAGMPVFAAHPVALDGPWINHYLRSFTGRALFEGPWIKDRLFHHAPFCLMSYVAGKTGRDYLTCDAQNYPPEWLGAVEHTHRAIDDARGYANLLRFMMMGKAGVKG